MIMPKNKRSFFERITGSAPANTYTPTESPSRAPANTTNNLPDVSEEEEGQLTLDIFREGDDIVVQAFVAGVTSPDLDVSITQDMLTIRGKRQTQREVNRENYYYRELYWGTFSRSVMLPEEVDVDSAQASTKNGLLTIRLKKLDRAKTSKLQVKNG